MVCGRHTVAIWPASKYLVDYLTIIIIILFMVSVRIYMFALKGPT